MNTSSEKTSQSRWKRVLRVAGLFLLGGVGMAWVVVNSGQSAARDRTWQVAASLGLSTDWKQWSAHQYYPEPEDNVACHPLFNALRRPGTAQPEWDFAPLGTEAKASLPAGANLVSPSSNSGPVLVKGWLEVIVKFPSHARFPRHLERLGIRLHEPDGHQSCADFDCLAPTFLSARTLSSTAQQLATLAPSASA